MRSVRLGDLRSSQATELHVQLVLSILTPGEYFVRISDVSIDEAGTIYVLDSGAHRVSIFNDQGALLTEFGREGDGPGEFRSPGRVLPVPGQLVIPDAERGRLFKFDRDGEVLGSVPLLQGRGLPMRWAVDDMGTLVVQYRSMDMPVIRSFGGTPGSDVLARVDIKTGSSSPLLPLTRSDVEPSQTGASPAMLKVFAPEPAWDLARDGRIVLGVNNEMRFSVVDDAGRASLDVSADVPARAVSESGKRIVLDLLREYFRRAGANPAELAVMSDVVEIGETYPVFTRLIFGPSRTVMVERPAEFSADSDPLDIFGVGDFDIKGFGSGSWDVFSPNGDHLGLVTFPPRFDPKAYRGLAIYGVHTDVNGVQSVRAYRIGSA